MASGSSFKRDMAASDEIFPHQLPTLSHTQSQQLASCGNAYPLSASSHRIGVEYKARTEALSGIRTHETFQKPSNR